MSKIVLLVLVMLLALLVLSMAAPSSAQPFRSPLPTRVWSTPSGGGTLEAPPYRPTPISRPLWPESPLPTPFPRAHEMRAVPIGIMQAMLPIRKW
jgi:hypothetical protein